MPDRCLAQRLAEFPTCCPSLGASPGEIDSRETIPGLVRTS